MLSTSLKEKNAQEKEEKKTELPVHCFFRQKIGRFGPTFNLTGKSHIWYFRYFEQP